jgi:hypothetical protein
VSRGEVLVALDGEMRVSIDVLGALADRFPLLA